MPEEQPVGAEGLENSIILNNKPKNTSSNSRNELPRSEHADDFDLLNSQKGTDQERRKAYDNIAIPTAQNVTPPQKQAIQEYVSSSTMINNYLRGDEQELFYPSPEQIPEFQEQAENISQGLKSNPLAEDTTAFKGITDKYLAMVFNQLGLENAVNEDGTINHEWLNRNQKTLRKKLVGKTFQDKAFTSTSTEKGFAQFWARKKAALEETNRLLFSNRKDEAIAFQKMTKKHPERVPGAHMIRFNLPKGSNASFVDRIAEKEGGKINQREILVDKGSFFKISDIQKGDGPDSYELVMDLLAEENGKKRK